MSLLISESRNTIAVWHCPNMFWRLRRLYLQLKMLKKLETSYLRCSAYSWMCLV